MRSNYVESDWYCSNNSYCVRYEFTPHTVSRYYLWTNRKDDMSNLARWIVGLLTVVLFPFTIALLAFYAILYKIPIFVGTIVEEIINEVRYKWLQK